MKIQVTLKVEPNTERNQNGDFEKRISPPANCMCCFDSGRAANEFLSHFVDIPKKGDFIPFICKRMDCEAGKRLIDCYEKSDRQREADWMKLAEKDPNIPRYTSQRVWQSNWSCALSESACESMHQWALQEWVERFVKRSAGHQIVDIKSEAVNEPKDVLVLYDKAVSDRNNLIKSIDKLIKSSIEFGVDITKNLDATLRMCRGRDLVDYHQWQDLPEGDLKRIEQGILSKLVNTQVA